MEFRIFINDRGPDRFSSFMGVNEATRAEALRTAEGYFRNAPKSLIGNALEGLVILAVPEEREDLWPHHINGKVGAEILEKYGLKVEVRKPAPRTRKNLVERKTRYLPVARNHPSVDLFGSAEFWFGDDGSVTGFFE